MLSFRVDADNARTMWLLHSATCLGLLAHLPVDGDVRVLALAPESSSAAETPAGSRVYHHLASSTTCTVLHLNPEYTFLSTHMLRTGSCSTSPERIVRSLTSRKAPGTGFELEKYHDFSEAWVQLLSTAPAAGSKTASDVSNSGVHGCDAHAIDQHHDQMPRAWSFWQPVALANVVNAFLQTQPYYLDVLLTLRIPLAHVGAREV